MPSFGKGNERNNEDVNLLLLDEGTSKTPNSSSQFKSNLNSYSRNPSNLSAVHQDNTSDSTPLVSNSDPVTLSQSKSGGGIFTLASGFTRSLSSGGGGHRSQGRSETPFTVVQRGKGQWRRLKPRNETAAAFAMSDQSENKALNGALPSRKKSLEWSKFGLGDKSSSGKGTSASVVNSAGANSSSGTSTVKELFHEQDEQTHSKPWWKANFFITEPVLFGTWDGVFTSTMMNIFGVIVFLRTGWMVANAGVGLSFLIVFMAVSVSLVTVLSAVGVCERLHLDAGGIYFLLSHILGAKLGSTIGIVYAFAQSVGVALYCTGFAESIALFLVITNSWLMKLIAIVTLLILIGINVAGVKWVVKVQLLLLLILAVSAMDFIVGSFLSTDEGEGVVGYHVGLLGENFKPSFDEEYGFFTVFGVFFSTVTGVMAGINMSGDLRNPSENIPDGTFAAIGVSTFLYLTHAFILGYTCLRDALRTDSLIQEKVALIGFVWVMGLFISSLSSSLGGLYGAPRILQCITVEKNFPILSFLAMGRGPNREPFYATLFTGLITLIFILIGQINFLGTVVTLPFLLTYAFINFAYFSIAMSYDKMMKISKYRDSDEKNSGESAPLAPRSGHQTPTDLRSKTPPPYSSTPSNSQEAPPAYGSVLESEGKESSIPDSPAKYLSNIGRKSKEDEEETTYTASAADLPSKKKKRWYMYLCNRWLSLANCCVCLFLMFLTNWLIALILITVTLCIYVYIGQANPGVYPGVSSFHFFHWLHSVITSCFGMNSNRDEYDQMIISPPMQKPDLATSQLTEENDDFSSRGKYHQSTKIHDSGPDTFKQY